MVQLKENKGGRYYLLDTPEEGPFGIRFRQPLHDFAIPSIEVLAKTTAQSSLTEIAS